MNRETAGRLARVAAAVTAGALVLLAVTTFLAYAGKRAGNWAAREFQVQNLGPLGTAYTATLLDAGGSPLWLDVGTLSPYSLTYLIPQGLPPGASGTLVVETDGPSAGAIAHFEGIGETGNEVYEMRDDAEATDINYLPWLVRDTRPGHANSLIVVHNRTGQETISVTYRFFDSISGSLAHTLTVGISGTHTLDLATLAAIPATWAGAAVVQGPGPLLVEVMQDDGLAWAAYLGASAHEAQPDLVLPWVAPNQPPLITSTVHVFNPSGASSASVVVQFDTGAPVPLTLPPFASGAVAAPTGGTPGSARITSDGPVTAVTCMAASGFGSQGALCLPAHAVPLLGNHAGVPLLYSGYLGWTHVPPAGAVRVYNAGHATAPVSLTYRSDLLPVSTVYYTTLGPGQYTDTYPPLAGAVHWSLWASSAQPVAVTVVGFNQGLTDDHWFAYRGTGFVPPTFSVCLPAVGYNMTAGEP